nr:MAG TPA: hypothetical protein [Caudoviricetes sp.]
MLAWTLRPSPSTAAGGGSGCEAQSGQHRRAVRFWYDRLSWVGPSACEGGRTPRADSPARRGSA